MRGVCTRDWERRCEGREDFQKKRYRLAKKRGLNSCKRQMTLAGELGYGLIKVVLPV